MASPQRPDPNEPGRNYEDLQRARMERRAAPGAGFAWWWFFWIVIIGLAIWWAGWGWGGTGGWWWGTRARTVPMYGTTYAALPPAANQAAINGAGLTVLNATDKHSYIGKSFTIYDVPYGR